MAEVPGAQYEPYFTAQPTERPIQLRGVDYPSGAFGENIAHALQTFGQDVEKGTDEVWRRAMALRQLQVDGHIRDLTTAYYNEVAPIEADFLTQRGANADGTAQMRHLANMETIRQKYMEQAKQYGIYGQDRFGTEASSMQRAFIIRATAHSAAQTKQATLDSYTASQNTAIDEAGKERNPTKRQGLIDDIGQKADAKSDIEGALPSTKQWNRTEAQSKGYVEGASGDAKRDVVNAPKILDDAIKSGKVDANGQRQLIDQGNRLIPHGADVWQQRVRDGQIPAFSDKKMPISRLTDAVKDAQSTFPGHTPRDLSDMLKEAGMPNMTQEEYDKDPKAQDKLMKFHLEKMQEEGGNAGEALSRWFGGKPSPDQMKAFNKRLAGTATGKEYGTAANKYGTSIQNESFPDVGIQYERIATDKQYTEENRERKARVESQMVASTAIQQGNPTTGQPWNSFVEFETHPANQQLMNQGRQYDPVAFDRYVYNSIISEKLDHMQQSDRLHVADLDHLLHGSIADKQKLVDMDNIRNDPKLSLKDQRYYDNKRLDLVNRGFVEPNLNRAYEILLNKFGSDTTGGEVPTRAQDEQGFMMYKSRVFHAMRAWEEENPGKKFTFGTGPNDPLSQIHQMLMEKGARGIFDWRGTPSYRAEPGGEKYDKYVEDVRKAFPNLSDAELRSEYITAQMKLWFENLYSKAGKAQDIPKTGPYDTVAPLPVSKPVEGIGTKLLSLYEQAGASARAREAVAMEKGGAEERSIRAEQERLLTERSKQRGVP
jgi:hypothetical protein